MFGHLQQQEFNGSRGDCACSGSSTIKVFCDLTSKVKRHQMNECLARDTIFLEVASQPRSKLIAKRMS